MVVDSWMVFIVLALGAECYWVGRPALWGLAVSFSPFKWFMWGN